MSRLRQYASNAERQRAHRARKRNERPPIVTPFYKGDLVTIYNGDMRAVLATLPAESVDVVITSPPYNLDVAYGSYDDGRAIEDYLAHVRQWAKALYRAARHAGRICLNVPLDTTRPARRFLAGDFAQIFTAEGWTYRTCIIWNEGNVSNHLARGSVDSPSAPNVITPVETLLVFYKGEWIRPANGRSHDLEHSEWLEWTNGLWTFPGESRPWQKHPAPFPVELPLRCLKLFAYRDDVVLDPFLGSGTTAYAAQILGRQCIGIELDGEFARSAADRCNTLFPLTIEAPAPELAKEA